MNDAPRFDSLAGFESLDCGPLLNWLAAVFAAPPDRAAVASYRRGPAADWLDEIALISAAARGIARMRAALAAVDDDALAAARLGAAYGLLFEGIGGPDTVSPYELVYRDEGRLFGAPTAEMEAILASHDLSVSPSAHEAADHIAVELSAAACLIERREPYSAMIERLHCWVPGFAGACAAADRDGFWAGAADVLESLVGILARRAGDVETVDVTNYK